MDDREELEPQEGLPMPEVLMNSDTNAPWTNCLQCNHDLTKGDRLYMVQKIFKRYPALDKVEVLFEFALCSQCHEEMKDGLSKESAANLSDYMMENVKFGSLNLRILEYPQEPARWLTHCNIKEVPIEEMSEYQMGACFRGDRLVTNLMPPMIIGDQAMEEMNALLSKETKDEMDDFMDEHFGVPPELRKDLVFI